jgi:hypothetical protein
MPRRGCRGRTAHPGSAYSRARSGTPRRGERHPANARTATPAPAYSMMSPARRTSRGRLRRGLRVSAATRPKTGSTSTPRCHALPKGNRPRLPGHGCRPPSTPAAPAGFRLAARLAGRRASGLSTRPPERFPHAQASSAGASVALYMTTATFHHRFRTGSGSAGQAPEPQPLCSSRLRVNGSRILDLTRIS